MGIADTTVQKIITYVAQDNAPGGAVSTQQTDKAAAPTPVPLGGSGANPPVIGDKLVKTADDKHTDAPVPVTPNPNVDKKAAPKTEAPKPEAPKPFLSITAKTTAQPTAAPVPVAKPEVPPKQETPKPAQPNKPHEGETGESLREKMDRFFDGKYSKADGDDKKQMDFIRRYFTDYFKNMPVSEQRKDTKQINDFIKMVHNTYGPKDCQKLGAVIRDLNEKNQLPAILETTVNNRCAQLRTVYEKEIAGEIHYLKPSVQLPATKIITQSDNAEAQKIAASHVYQLDAKNQVPAVKLYETNVKDRDVLIAVNKSFVNQYSQFAVENQLAIHKEVLNTGIPEVIKAASANINSLDVSVRSEAVQEVRNVYATLSDTDKAAVDESLDSVTTSAQSSDSSNTANTASAQTNSALQNLSKEEQAAVQKITEGKDTPTAKDYSTVLDLLSGNKLDEYQRKNLADKIINSSYMKSQLSQIPTLDQALQMLIVEAYISSGNVMDLKDKVGMFTNKTAQEKLQNKINEENEKKQRTGQIQK